MDESGVREGNINTTSAPPTWKMKSPTESVGYKPPARARLGGLGAWAQGLMRGTIFSSIFTLLTTCIGAGTLSLPYAFEQGGLVPSSIIFFLIMVVSVVVGFLLFSSKRYCGELYPGMAVWGYEDLALAAFGPIGKIIVLLTLIVLLFLSLIAYMIYTRDQLDLIVQFILARVGQVPACSPLMNCAVLMTIAFLPIFPITLLRDLTPMQITSTFSIICISYVGVTMFIKMVTYQHDHFHDTRSVAPRHLQGLLITISYCSLSFVCHFNLLPLQKELHRPTKKRMNIIMIGSMLLAYTLYNLVIFSGFFRFYGELKDDVMLNYSPDDVLMTTARVAIFFTLLFSYPVLLHPTRAAINRLVIYLYQLVRECSERQGRRRRGERGRSNEVNRDSGSDGWETEEEEGGGGVGEKETLLASERKVTKPTSDVKIPLPIWISETWMLFAITFICASFIPNVGLVWNFVGSIGGTLVLYIFPPAFYLRLRYTRYIHRRREEGVSVRSQYSLFAVVRETIAAVILVTGCLLLIAENYSAVEAVFNQDHSPSSLCYQAKCSSIHNASSLLHTDSPYTLTH